MMKVIELETPNLMDVPASLRKLADMLESGEEPESMHAIVVSVDGFGEIRVYGYGKVGTRANEIGTLFQAALKLND
jgi:hypothetical protein